MFKSIFGDFSEHVFEFTEEWTGVRLIGAMRSVYEFWIPIVGKSGKRLLIRKICLDWDAETHSMTSDHCPYRKAGLKGRPLYYSNAIIRCARKSVMPVRVLKIPPRPHQSLESFAYLNCRTTKSGKRRRYDLAHPKFGRDIQIKINPETPYGYYDLEPLERTPLTERELHYHLFPLVIKPETPRQAEAEWKKLRKVYADG